MMRKKERRVKVLGILFDLQHTESEILAQPQTEAREHSEWLDAGDNGAQNVLSLDCLLGRVGNKQ